MPEGLQLILGADNRNSFTLYKDEINNRLHVYFGMGLFEVIEDYKNSVELKYLLARLYNSNVKVKTLITHFGFSYPTYKRWGDALRSGDSERIHFAFSGQGGGKKKLTTDVLAFIIHDFKLVYDRNKYSYSAEIRKDVKDVFNIELSSECIRPLLTSLKNTYDKQQHLTEDEKKKIYKTYLK